MPLKNIVGQDTARRILEGFLGRGNVPHSLLFCGPDGSGKRTTATAFAQAVNCAEPDGTDACGRCPSCSRIGKGVDMDVMYFFPTRTGILRETAEIIRREASITPNSALRKFLIIDRAEKLIPESANLLLKVFEEPPESTVFVLMTDSEHLVLPTIRSRAIKVPFKPLTRGETFEIAAGRLTEEQAEFLHPIAKGDMGFMLQLTEDENMKEVFEALEEFLSRRLDGPGPVSPALTAGEFTAIAERVDLSTDDDTESTGRRKSLVFALEVLLVLLEQRFHEVVSGSGGQVIIDGGLEKICRLMEIVLGTIKAVERGGHTALALEMMTIDYHRAAAG